MTIYKDLYEFCNYNTKCISDALGVEHIDTRVSYEEFCASVKHINNKSVDSAFMSKIVKAQFDNGRPANITFAGKKHSEESLEKMKTKRAGRTPSKGKTWKRTPESIARAMETQRLNRIKKLELDI
jgi:hypothetical protein